MCTVPRFFTDLPPLTLKMTVADIVLCLQMEENCCPETVLGSQYLRFSPALPSAFLSEFLSQRGRICSEPSAPGPAPVAQNSDRDSGWGRLHPRPIFAFRLGLCVCQAPQIQPETPVPILLPNTYLLCDSRMVT